MRKITLKSGVWEYSIGKSDVKFRFGNKTFIVPCHTVAGISDVAYEKGQYKGSSFPSEAGFPIDGRITPKQIREFIESKLLQGDFNENPS